MGAIDTKSTMTPAELAEMGITVPGYTPYKVKVQMHFTADRAALERIKTYVKKQGATECKLRLMRPGIAESSEQQS